MRRTVTPVLIAFIALSTVGHGHTAAQSSNPAVARLSLAGPAKRYCSGIWVSERNRTEALYNSVLLGSGLVEQYESGRLGFDIDDERRVVTATRDGVSASARHFGDQGCVILRPETDKPVFTPRRVVSSLPDAVSTPWPMGDALPDAPLPALKQSRLRFSELCGAIRFRCFSIARINRRFEPSSSPGPTLDEIESRAPGSAPGTSLVGD